LRARSGVTLTNFAAHKPGTGSAKRAEGVEVFRRTSPALLAGVRAGLTPTAAAGLAGLRRVTARAWCAREAAGVHEYAGFTEALRQAAAGAAAADREELGSRMAALLGHMRAGATAADGARRAGITRGALRVWLDKGAAGTDPFAGFLRDYRILQLRPASASPTREKRGLVYFVEGSAGGLIKIGFTRFRMADRLRQLQVGSPVPLRVRATVEAPMSVERWLHATFLDDRSHGEWFRPSDRLMDFLTSASRSRRLASPVEARALLRVRRSVRQAG
jgi:hypothetical protein